MPHRTFLAFILPSLFVMIVFIAMPIVSVAYQSLFVEHEKVMTSVQSCGPFGCTSEVRIDTAAMEKIREEQPMGRFNWLGTYTNPGHLAFDEVAMIWRASPTIGAAILGILDLPLYKALSFTVVYTFVVTPLAMALGFVIAV